MKTIINSKNAPSPIGPYSQAVLSGNTLFASGQIAINPKTGELNMDSIEVETEQVMQNIKAVLQEANMTFENIVKCSIFLSNMDSFSRVNEVYGKYFPTNPPARETVEVSCLPKSVNVEISFISVI
jgi:2-iminobutanoate/2-iminopropanoate deaminase